MKTESDAFDDIENLRLAPDQLRTITPQKILKRREHFIPRTVRLARALGRGKRQVLQPGTTPVVPALAQQGPALQAGERYAQERRHQPGDEVAGTAGTGGPRADYSRAEAAEVAGYHRPHVMETCIKVEPSSVSRMRHDFSKHASTLRHTVSFFSILYLTCL